jgi:hypothetical protein
MTPPATTVVATASLPATIAEVFTPTFPAIPTEPATATPIAIPTATLTPLVVPVARVEGEVADGTCVEVDDAVTIPEDVFGRPDFESDIEAYLNAGGAISDLPQVLVPTDVDRAIRLQIVSQDITGSGVPDLFIGVTLPYGNGDGETHLLFFACVEEQYEGEILFRRAGAGSRSEGLYEGGGVNVKSVGDINGNGRGDVLLSVNWPGYGEHYLLEWEGNQFVSLIEYKGLLGESRVWIETHGEGIDISDVDGDGILEIVVGEEGAGQAIWRWDGERYSRDLE